MKASTIGLDIATSVFQVHVEDATGKIVLQKRRPARLDADQRRLEPGEKRHDLRSPQPITGAGSWVTKCD